MRRGFVRSVLLTVVLACGWQATVAAPALAERGRSAPGPNPTKLWKAYPLMPREQSFPGTKPAAAAQTRIAAPGSSDGRQSWPLPLVSFALALAILAGGLLLLRRSRRLSGGGLAANNLVHRFPQLGGERHDDGSEVVAAAETAGPVRRKDTFTAHSMRGQERKDGASGEESDVPKRQ
jgi:hypothetical protein